MKKLLLAVFLFTGCFSYAQDGLTQNSIKAVLTGNQSQVIQLAEAFPEDKYDWRPSEGISSVGEALLHVAGGNYFLASKLGFAPPEDVDVMGLNKITGKENIIAALKKSNEFVLENITKVEDGTLDEEVDFGFMKSNKLGGLLAIMEHNGEHKGQLIAYARSNDVVPPWSE
ncbi:DinB family protein [Maribacter forsetii]|uniref:DinB family protein n=1 Tax=Maribacter forsetii TaxID=444515 RepID=UPI00056CBAE0|nr:DinB family protein [Maribacter forsetii]